MNGKAGSFTLICDVCGGKEVFVTGGHNGEVFMKCQGCGNHGDDWNGSLILNGNKEERIL